jgi:hypothetical protein
METFTQSKDKSQPHFIVIALPRKIYTGVVTVEEIADVLDAYLDLGSSEVVMRSGASVLRAAAQFAL